MPFEAATGVDDPSGVCGDNPTAIAVRQAGLAVIDILISDAARGLCDLTFDNAGFRMHRSRLRFQPVSPQPM